MGFFQNLRYKTASFLVDGVSSLPFWSSISIFGGNTAERNIKAYVERGYGKNPYVYMVVKKISDLTSRLPFVIVDANGKVQQDINYSLFLQPNEKQTTQEFIDTLITELEVTGNAYIRIIKVGARPVELSVLSTKKVSLQIDSKGNLKYYEYSEFTTKEKIPVEDIWHIKFNNPTGSDNDRMIGLSPLQSAMQIVESSNDIFEAEGHLFKNRGVSTLLTNDSDRPMLPKEKADIQKEWNEEIGGPTNYGKVKITTSKLRGIDIGLTPAQLQLSQNSIAKLRVIAACYGISPMIFGDTERSTYNNMQEAEKAMYLNVIIPLAELICKELTLLFKQYFNTKNKIAVDTTKISVLNAIDAALIDNVIKELNAGIINLNEARIELGLSEIELPKNTSTLNGAQVTSLIEVLTGLGNGTIPVESARAVINAAFPTIPQEYINQIVDAYKLKPKSNG